MILLLTCFFSFAVNRFENVMIPKNPSITDADIGGDELSAMDITKLKRGYSCQVNSVVCQNICQ